MTEIQRDHKELIRQSMPLLILIVLGVVIPLTASANDQRYENLHNLTEYLFSSANDKVLSVLRRIQGPESWGPLAGSYDTDQGAYHFGVFDYYTIRYWSGLREKRNEVDPPEAGRIGTIQCGFYAHVAPKGDSKTLVSITVESFEQQVGRRYKIFPHFQKVPVFDDVKSDSYFEYVFLLRLGELLGEKSMPPIKGSADGDTRD